jgi:hypothetical protein
VREVQHPLLGVDNAVVVGAEGGVGLVGQPNKLFPRHNANALDGIEERRRIVKVLDAQLPREVLRAKAVGVLLLKVGQLGRNLVAYESSWLVAFVEPGPYARVKWVLLSSSSMGEAFFSHAAAMAATVRPAAAVDTCVYSF